VYRFPAKRTFSGPALWNPYERLRGTWQRANFHAHGRAWGGLTDGRQPDEEVVRAYTARGYSVPGISNYHHIAAPRGVETIPLYEHGYNIAKHHQIAIGARQVDWFDFPVWQGLHQKQYAIERVGRTADLVALVHPWSGYSEEDLRDLTRYQLLEVVNGPYSGEALWDAALSSGHAVWALANDDTHDVTDAKRTEVAWNMIDAPSAREPDIVAALQAGRSYAVSLVGSHRDLKLKRAELDGAMLTVSTSGVPATFLFVAQGGAVRKAVEQQTTATYTVTSDDQYIRTIIRTPNLVVYLNPVIRYDGIELPSPVATVNESRTWIQRGLVATGALAIVTALWRRPSRSPGRSTT
jgi:hypothetical protein